MASKLNIVIHFGIHFSKAENSDRITVMVNPMTIMVNQSERFEYLNIEVHANALVQLAWF